MKFRHCVIAIVVAGSVAACGGSDDATSADETTPDSVVDDAGSSEVDVPEGATMCDVYKDDYKPIVDSPTPFGEDGWDAEARELVLLSGVLAQLAPAEQAGNAEANVGYFQALADVESASEFIEGSNAFNLYLIETCLT